VLSSRRRIPLPPRVSGASLGIQLPGLLEERSFRLLWFGESISTLGSQFNIVALAIVALQLGGGLSLGAVLVAAALPRAGFMLVGGWLADRTSPRRILLVANVLRAILAGLLAIVVASGAAELPVLALLGFMFGTVDAFFLPAVNAAVPLLVDGGRLGSANAWLQGTAQVAALMGPALAGGLVSASGAGPAFAIDSASFVFAALAVRSIPAHAVRAHDGGSDGRDGLLEGLRYARRDVPVAIITVLATLFFFAITGPLAVGVPWLGERRFGGAAAIGVMLAAWSGGALVGAVLASKLDSVERPGRLILSIGTGVGLSVASVSLAGALPWATVALAVMGIGSGILNVFVLSLIQRRVDPAVRGRVVSLLVLGTVALAPLSYAVSAVVVEAVGPFLFALAGALIVVVSGVSFALGAHRVIDRPRPLGSDGRQRATVGSTSRSGAQDAADAGLR
jgi:MFS family permease